MFFNAALAALFVTAMDASQTQRWVPPPAPQVIDGKTIFVDAESNSKGRFVIHLHKPQQADWRQTRYVVELERNDSQPFWATLKTHPFPFVGDDEVLFLTIPAGSEANYKLQVIDQSQYPHVRVFSGTLDSIPLIKD